MRTCIGFRFVRLALMIEGQEGVTWDDWVALASACEEHGVEALFRSDHYVSGFDETRTVLDAWATIAGLASPSWRSKSRSSTACSARNGSSSRASAIDCTTHPGWGAPS